MQENLISNGENHILTEKVEKIRIYFEKFYSALKDSNFFKNKDVELLFHLGAYINDTIFKQQKYFKTKGLIKKIIPFLNFFGPLQVESILDLSNRIQVRISKKYFIKTSFLRKILIELNSEIDKGNYISSQEDLLSSFSFGFILYSKSIKYAFSKEKDQNYSFSSLISEVFKRSKKVRENSDIFKKSLIQNNDSFQLGYLFGDYYLNNTIKQFNILKTQSLIKIIPSMLKKINLKRIKKAVFETTKVNFKIAAVNKNKNTESEYINLLSSNSLIGIYYLLIIKSIELNESHFSLGFFLALNNKDFNLIENKARKITDGLEIQKDVKEDNKIKSIQITPEEYEIYIETHSVNDPLLKLAFLVGIFLNYLNYYESKILSTQRLKKKIPLAMRHMNFQKLLNVINEIFYVYISCWGKLKQKGKIFLILPQLRMKLISTFGDIESFEISDAGITIHFIKGYNYPRKLSWEKFKTKNKN